MAAPPLVLDAPVSLHKGGGGHGSGGDMERVATHASRNLGRTAAPSVLLGMTIHTTPSTTLPTCREMPVEAASEMIATSLRPVMKASFSCGSQAG